MSVVELKREIEKYKDANIKIRSEIQIKEDIISKQNEEKKALTNRVKYLENFLNNLIVNCGFIQKNGVIPAEALQGIK